jgi:hypothetical protein
VNVQVVKAQALPDCRLLPDATSAMDSDGCISGGTGLPRPNYSVIAPDRFKIK